MSKIQIVTKSASNLRSVSLKGHGIISGPTNHPPMIQVMAVDSRLTCSLVRILLFHSQSFQQFDSFHLYFQLTLVSMNADRF